MLSQARNVTIHDGNFGVVHGNQYINKYNAPISKRYITYGDTFSNSTVRRTSRGTHDDGQVGSQPPAGSQSGTIAVFRPRMTFARSAPSRSHIPMHSLPKSEWFDSPEGSLIAPTQRTHDDIGHPTHPRAISNCPADDLVLERRSSSSSQRNEHLGDTFIGNHWTPNEVSNNDICAAAPYSPPNLFPAALERPPSACGEHTNNSRNETLESRSSPRSMCNAWLRQTEQQGISDERARTSDCRDPDYAPSEATSFYRIPSEYNWDADDEHESQGSERGTASIARPNSTVRGLINHIVEMGFTRKEVIRCMIISDNDPDLAVEYLMNGIPTNKIKS